MRTLIAFVVTCFTITTSLACLTNKCMNDVGNGNGGGGIGGPDVIIDVNAGRGHPSVPTMHAIARAEFNSSYGGITVSARLDQRTNPVLHTDFSVQCQITGNIVIVSAYTYDCGCERSNWPGPTDRNSRVIHWDNTGLYIRNEASLTVNVSNQIIMFRFIVSPCLNDTMGRPAARPTIVEDLDKCSPIVQHPDAELDPVILSLGSVSGPLASHVRLTSSEVCLPYLSVIDRGTRRDLGEINIQMDVNDGVILFEFEIDRYRPMEQAWNHLTYDLHIAVYDCNCTLINQNRLTSVHGIAAATDLERILPIRLSRQPAYAVMDWNATANASISPLGFARGSRKFLLCINNDTTCTAIGSPPPTNKIDTPNTCRGFDCSVCVYPPYPPCPAPCGSTTVQTRTRTMCMPACPIATESRTCRGVCVLSSTPEDIVGGITGGNVTRLLLWIGMGILVGASCIPIAIQLCATATQA